MKYTIIIMLSTLAVNHAHAKNDMPPTMCDHMPLMKCLSKSTSDCTNSMQQALNICTSDIDTKSDKFDAKEIAERVRPCLSVQILNQFGLTQTDFDKCEIEFNDANTATMEWLEKEIKAADERFFTEDDPLHNYEQ